MYCCVRDVLPEGQQSDRPSSINGNLQPHLPTLGAPMITTFRFKFEPDIVLLRSLFSLYLLVEVGIGVVDV